MRRLSLILIPAILAAAALASYLLWHASDNLPALGRNVETGTVAIGGPFVLTDQNGAKRASADFRGRYMLIYFGYSTCPDVCPTTLVLMADALDKLGAKADAIVPIFISIDPQRDTAAKLKTYLAVFGPRFIGLTGDLASIARVAGLYRVYMKKQPLAGGSYAMDHSSVIYLMGPNGKFVAYWDDTSIGPDKLAIALRERI